MVEHLHDSHLTEELLTTGRGELGLVNDFDGHLLAGDHMAGQFDFGEVAFADGANEPVFTDLGLIVSDDLWGD